MKKNSANLLKLCISTFIGMSESWTAFEVLTRKTSFRNFYFQDIVKEEVLTWEGGQANKPQDQSRYLFLK